MKRFLLVLPILIAATVFYFATPMQHSMELHAQPINPLGTNEDIKTTDKDGNTVSCSTYPDSKGGKILGKMVPCMIHTILNSTTIFSQKMIKMFMPVIMSFMTFVGIMFGVRVLQGERQIGSQAFLLLFKMAIVVGVINWISNPAIDFADSTKTMPSLIEIAFNAINEGVTLTTSVIGVEEGDFHCNVADYGDENTPLIWKQMDCVLGKIYGFSTGKVPGVPNVFVGASALGLLTGFFFGGTIGVAVFFALLGILWSLVMLVLRVMLAFVNGYLIVCVMMLIAPFFLPLMLLKVTNDYFEKWWKAILGGILLPIIITAYTMFALLLYDTALFKPDSLLVQLFNSDAAKPAMEHARTPCDFNVTNEADFKADVDNPTAAQLQDILKSPFLQDFAKPLLGGGSDPCAMLKVDVFDITKVNRNAITLQDDPNFKKGKEAMMKIFLTAVELFILTWLISAGLNTVEGVISGFAGSSLAGAALTARSDVDTKATGMFRQFQSKVSNVFASDAKDKKGRLVNPGGLRGKDFANAASKITKPEFFGNVRK